MNILIVSAVFPPEPIVSAKIAYELSSFLSLSNNIIVLCPKPTRPYGFAFCSAKIIENNINRIELSTYTSPKASIIGRFRESFSFGYTTSKYIKKNHTKIDAIYADTWPLFGQYFVVRTASKYNIPIAIHIQDIYPESLSNKIKKLSFLFNFFLLPIDKYILRKASIIIAISDYMKDYLAKTRNIKKEKISVVLNWQDETSFLQVKNHSKNDKFTFMYLGNLGPVAGIELLLDAFTVAHIPNSRLIIAGSGSMKDELITKAALKKDFDIQFCNVPEGKVAEIQSMANVMLLPIKKGAALSSIPSKLPAYMFSSKPIICCADSDSDTANCIRDANCGYVIEPENIEALSKVLLKMSQQKHSTLNEMGKRGRQYALEVFSKEGNLNKLVNIINNLSNKHVLS